MTSNNAPGQRPSNPPVWQNPFSRASFREGGKQVTGNSQHEGEEGTAVAAATDERMAQLQGILKKKLGPEYLSHRSGTGPLKLTYVEGWRVINLANEIFGYNGWFTEIKCLDVDFIDYNEVSMRFNIGVSAIVKVWLKDGGCHEDVGYGKLENGKSKADGLDKCKKEAVTDALKRALRHFGNALGNCLYDKDYTENVAKMKAAKPKFRPSELYRPDYELNSVLKDEGEGRDAAAVSSETTGKLSNGFGPKDFTPKHPPQRPVASTSKAAGSSTASLRTKPMSHVKATSTSASNVSRGDAILGTVDEDDSSILDDSMNERIEKEEEEETNAMLLDGLDLDNVGYEPTQGCAIVPDDSGFGEELGILDVCHVPDKENPKTEGDDAVDSAKKSKEQIKQENLQQAQALRSRRCQDKVRAYSRHIQAGGGGDFLSKPASTDPTAAHSLLNDQIYTARINTGGSAGGADGGGAALERAKSMSAAQLLKEFSVHPPQCQSTIPTAGYLPTINVGSAIRRLQTGAAMNNSTKRPLNPVGYRSGDVDPSVIGCPAHEPAAGGSSGGLSAAMEDHISKRPRMS